MTTAIMKDGGEKQTFETGAQRDTAEGKPMYRFLPPFAWKYVHPRWGAFVTNALTSSSVGGRASYFEDLYSRLLDEVGHDRLLEWLRQGSLKYDPFNWAKGISCLRCIDSLGRHLRAAALNKGDEDHLAAALCNVMFICQYLERAVRGNPIPEIVDFYDFSK